MPSVNKEIAEKLVERLKRQKEPKVYCVVSYQNRLNGDSERGTFSGYKICNRPDQYQALMRSDLVGGVDPIWQSKRFKADMAIQELLDD